MGERVETSFFNTFQFWATDSLAGAIVLTKLFPECSVRQSLLLTAATIFLTQWLIYSIYAVIIYPRFLSPLRHLPTVTENNSFFFGQWFHLMKEPNGLPMRKFLNDVPNNGLIRYFHMFNRERILLTSPKAISEVLSTKCYDFVKPDFFRNNLGRILGIGILFAEGEEHRVQRKSLSPAFAFRHIKELYPLFWSKSRQMVKAIETQIHDQQDSNTVDAAQWASRATLDIIGIAGIGQDFDSLTDPNTELNRVYRTVFSPTKGQTLIIMLSFILPQFLIRALPLQHNSNVSEAVRVVRQMSRNVIRKKKSQLEKQEKTSPDIISVAVESGAFTEDELVNNTMTFLAAGHETTATAFTWSIYMLGKHPKIQQRLRDEVRAHINSLDDEINSTIIDEMPYLHAFCQEILRFWAPVPLTIRNTAVNTTVIGQFVPKGTKIIVAPWAVNFSKELWGEDADQFNPDRWMASGQANSGGAQSNYAFLTYLHGPRSCIGSRFASAELACLLAAFMGRFEFELSEPDRNIKIIGRVTARPDHGMKVNVKTVDGW